MKKIKLAVFDLEGTIFRNFFKGRQVPSLWAVLCNRCGPDALAEDSANRNKWLQGGYHGNYSQWVIDTLRIHQKYGLKRAQFEQIINDTVYFDGVADTFAALREQGIAIAIISGGLKALADRVALDFQIEHCFASAEYFWNPDGTIRHWNVIPTDFGNKRTVLKMLCHDLGISSEECLFVGDGRNDKAVAGFCALSIGFNPHDELRHEVDIIIEQSKGREDLSAVLQPLAKYPHFSHDDFSAFKVWKVQPLATKKEKSTGTLSTSGQRNAFHAFLVRNGLTSKSSDSYCSYLNNLCKNAALASWMGATTGNAFTLLEQTAQVTSSEEGFVQALAIPFSGPHGRENDLSSVSRQFFRFTTQGVKS